MEAEEELYAAHKILTDFLSVKKMRQTIEREKILDCIYAYNGHFKPNTIYELMQNDFRVSKATVYNTFETLLECNLIVSHHFLHDRVEYEKTTANATHHHRICTKCGEVQEFSDLKIKRAIKNRTFTTFDTEYSTVYLYGICKKCKKKYRLK
ncbi:MAG: transcriptional repressor [Paludibacteraceae bacterium]|nr:transcriptional repressor [Paludibacteraceae bacterium]